MNQTLLTNFFEDKEVLIIFLFIVPFFLRVIVNSLIINKRDQTGKNILFLSPAKQDSYDFLLEAMLRFWWPTKDGKSHSKTTSNLLSLVFLTSLGIVILNKLVEAIFYN